MKKDFSIAKKLLLQILIVLILFSVSVIGLRKANLIKFPEFIEDIISPVDSSENDYAGTGYEIFQYLSDNKYLEDNAVSPEIDINNLRAMLSSLEPYENYYWECSAEIFSGASGNVKDSKLRISGNKYNLEIYDENGNALKKYISDGSKTSISDYRYGNGKKVYHSGIFDFYSDASIISVGYFKESEFTEDNCEIQLVEKETFNLISLIHSYNRDSINVENHYMISLDFGVVLFAQCYENDRLVYNFRTNSIYPLSGLEDELFTVD